jgi:hypothetical protein
MFSFICSWMRLIVPLCVSLVVESIRARSVHNVFQRHMSELDNAHDSWVSHFLLPDLKRKRVELVKEPLDILCFEERTPFHTIITGANPGLTWIVRVLTSEHALLMMSLKESVSKFSMKR